MSIQGNFWLYGTAVIRVTEILMILILKFQSAFFYVGCYGDMCAIAGGRGGGRVEFMRDGSVGWDLMGGGGGGGVWVGWGGFLGVECRKILYSMSVFYCECIKFCGVCIGG
jgi:hypothetical protein